jgi:hypothetical protein
MIYVINKQIIIDAFKFCHSEYVEDPMGQVTKMLVEELLFRHDMKPPYTNAN